MLVRRHRMIPRRRWALAWALAFAPALAVSAAMDSDALLESARQYVRALDLDCTLTDGYRCAEVEEDTFLTGDIGGRMVPGPQLEAWTVVYADFLALDDLEPDQKALRHYRIGFTEDPGHFVIVFSGLLLPYIGPDGQPDGVINAVFGRSIQYRVAKGTLEIASRLYFR